jgi:putative membrane protein insertion efficiency factor
VLARAMIAAIRFYRKGISPLKPPVCRFTPTCSAYGLEAVERYGAARGGWLLVKRLARCQPFSKGGYDPVP